ncbi:hypothetical protein [Candidatus Pantoea soli]|uniref:Uncharacterized protein n=1 Tax=Candidatus Pantoea soli TaxID=3098669 RepID=A0A518XDZ8_9GAMM|nr:hypothetical protein [Pantoea soli]QDY42431.1 hypothetical protein D8B20_11245 [Pantoea soli]
MLSKLFSLIPHGHRWHRIRISRKGALRPGSRAGLATHITARCQRCGARIEKIYYRDISDAQARRWLG